jgi:trans-aconitate 2-methyltransferase
MSSGSSSLPEWDATTYHRVSTPQHGWGQRVLDRLPLVGSETVVDAGCGTGRLTAELLELLPSGEVIAVDRSANMLAAAEAFLRPRFGGKVRFVQADVANLVLQSPVDAIFSTATFHWILDHPLLFESLFACLRPGGKLVAQCGGGPNVERLRLRAESLLDSSKYALRAEGWHNPWHFATPEQTTQRLRQAGFVDVSAWLEPAPTTFVNEPEFTQFVQSVVLREHLEAIPDPTDQASFLTEIAGLASSDNPPYTIDYWRLNLEGRRPAS